MLFLQNQKQDRDVHSFTLYSTLVLEAQAWEKEKKHHADWKGRSKLPLFTHDRIIYVENTMESTEQLLELIHEFSRLQDLRSRYKNQLHLYILEKNNPRYQKN